MKKLFLWINLLNRRTRWVLILSFFTLLIGGGFVVYKMIKVSAEAGVITNFAQLQYLDSDNNSHGFQSNIIHISISSTNNPPTIPSNISPSNGETYINPDKVLVLVKSNFSDPDGNNQSKYQFQVTSTAGNYSSPIADSGEYSSTSNSFNVNAGTLSYGTRYFWRVRVQDNSTAQLWSDWSLETNFLTCDQGLCNGSLIKTASAPQIYLISAGKKCHISTWQNFLAYNFNLSQINTISDSQLSSIPSGSTVNRLITSQSYPETYFMSQGKKYWITSPQVFLSLGFRWGDIFFADNSFVAGFPQETPIRRIGKNSTDPKVYLLLGQAGKGDGAAPLSKKWIVNADTFVSGGFGWSEIETISQSELDSYATGPSLYKTIMAEGNPKVYLMSGGVKHWITSPAVFYRYGLNWGELTVLPAGLVESYREGPAIY